MQILPLDIPPGFVRGGTELQTAGRWRDGSLVRWRDGILQPVGGWSDRVDMALPNPPRAALGWLDNGADRWVAVGTAAGLFVVAENNTIYDVTPAGFVVGITDSAVNTGYGGGLYGAGTYGTPRADTSLAQPATSWALDNWGENLVGVSDADGGIYEWALDTAADAVAVANAPTASALIVTEERFLFALGADGEGRKVQWSDRENNTVWTPASTNEAGEFTLTGCSQIMCGARVRGQTLILTDETAHTATYQGPPFVYGFERVGTACGALSRRAVAVSDAGAFWMGAGGFFRYAGGSVEPMVCPVSDFVFSGLNRAQQSKIHAVSNAEFGEIWWFYPDDGSSECNRYVAFCYRENHWLIGEIDRTCGFDKGPFGNPIWFSPDGVAYRQEAAPSAGAGVWAETGALNFGNGAATALEMFPDERTSGQVTGTFMVRQYPNGAETTFGPYAMSQKVDLRFTGRQMRMRIDGLPGAAWSVGVNQLRFNPRGTR